MLGQQRFTKRKKVPSVLQFEAVECGAAALSMILRRWGLYLPLSEVRLGCGVNRDGCNLKDIALYAQSLGVKVQGKRLHYKQLLKPNQPIYPCIAFWNFSHFVVLEGVGRNGKIFICDPAQGHYTLSESDFSKRYTGVILVATKTDSFVARGKPENELASLIYYLNDFKYSLLATAVLTLVSVIPIIIVAGLKGAFVNQFLIDRRYGFGIPIIWLTLAMLLLTFFTSLTYKFIFRRMLLKLMRKLSISIAKKVFTNDYNFYLSRLRGDIASRFTLGIYIAQTLITELVASLLQVISALLILPILFVMSWQLALASAFYVVFAVLLMTYFAATLKDVNRSIDYDSAKVEGKIASFINERELIVSTSQEQNIISNWLNSFALVSTKVQINFVKVNIFEFVFSFMNSVYRYGTIVLSGLLVIKGELNLAGFMAFQALRSYVIDPLTGLASLSANLQEAEASLGRLTDLFSVKDDPKVRSLNSVHSLVRLTGKIPSSISSESATTKLQLDRVLNGDLNVRRVFLQFSKISNPVISDISFTLKSGQMMTIVGPSGSGKSVLIKLLTGLYDPSSGSINYSQKHWLDYTNEAIRTHIGYVSQETSGFRGTIQENISIFDDGIPLNMVREASRLAEIDQTVISLDQSYNTFLGDGGSGLSGGQLQRLEIARAIVHQPKLIFLDEATSNLDIPTEKRVLKNLRATGATLVCVAHRLLSAEMSDFVMVLDQGKVVEFGSPSELRKMDGIYTNLLEQEKIYD